MPSFKVISLVKLASLFALTTAGAQTFGVYREFWTNLNAGAGIEVGPKFAINAERLGASRRKSEQRGELYQGNNFEAGHGLNRDRWGEVTWLHGYMVTV